MHKNLRPTTLISAAATCLTVGLAVCLAACGSSPARAGSPAASGGIPVKVQMTFIPNSQNYAITHGIRSGAYAKAGLDVSYAPGGIGVDPIQVVAAGKAQIGISQQDKIVIAEGKGIKLKVLGAEFGNSALGMICRTDSGVHRLADIAGKKIAVKAIAAQNFDVLLATNGIQKSTLTVIPVANDDSATLISGRAACVYAGLALNEPQIIKQAGVDNLMLLDSDNGLAAQDNVYFTTEQYYAQHKDDVLAPWVHVTQREWAGFADNPDAAATWVLDSKLVDGLNADQERFQATAMVPFLRTAYDQQHGLLALEPDLWTAAAQRVHAAGSTDTVVDTASMLDTSLVDPSIR
jgi:NitT/TauT family transport system substrate-binding protein